MIVIVRQGAPELYQNKTNNKINADSLILTE